MPYLIALILSFKSETVILIFFFCLLVKSGVKFVAPTWPTAASLPLSGMVPLASIEG